MHAVISMLPALLETLVAQSWHQLLQDVAAHRGGRVTDWDAYGEALWYGEWGPVMEEDAYAAEIGHRLAAVQLLRYAGLTGDERDRALAVATAPLPPELFRQHVLFAQTRRDGWDILLERPAVVLPDGLPPIPACYSHLLWGEPREGGTHRVTI